MKTGTQIKRQVRRIAKAIQTRIDYVQQLGQLNRRPSLRARFRWIVNSQAKAGLRPARRLMESDNYNFSR